MGEGLSEVHRKKLEWAGVGLLLLAALVPRVRDIAAPLDRELDGFQGACFAIGAINYERLGINRFGGYPSILHVDLPDDPEAERFAYLNHPPLVPLVTWGSLKLLGPEGWDVAWAEGRPPVGFEFALRLPFLLFHLAGLLALWWAARRAGGVRIAMLALALVSVTPLSILYAGLVNYENPASLAVLLAAGFHASWLRTGSKRALIGLGAASAAGAAVTFAPVFFSAAILLHTLLRHGLRTSVREGLAIVAGTLPVVILHGTAVRLIDPDTPGILGRAWVLLSPMFDGTTPPGEWAVRQAIRMEEFFTWPLLAFAAGGLVLWGLARLRRDESGTDSSRPLDLGPVLLLGGLLVLLGFYKHSWDGDGARNGQTSFLLYLVPGIVLCAATALDAIATRLERVRVGRASPVILVALVALPALGRAASIRMDWRAPGPWDDPALASGPKGPLPITAGGEIAGLVEPGTVVLLPQAMGLHLATSLYGWRTTLPVTVISEQATRNFMGSFGLGEQPLRLLLPRSPTGAVAEQCTAMRASLALTKIEAAPADGEGHWEVFRIGPD